MNCGNLISESEYSKVFCRIEDNKPQWIFYDKQCRTYQTISEQTAMRVLDCHAKQVEFGVEFIKEN